MNVLHSAPRSPLHSKMLLVSLILVFVMPLLIAIALYQLRHWVPLPQADPHGDLITPADPIGRFDVRTVRGRSLDKAFLRDQWTLVYVGGSRCDLWCEASLFKMRQVRLTLGEDQDRVQRLYLLTDMQAMAGLRPLLRRHGSMVVATPREASRRKVLTQFGPRGSGDFFLIDPNANLMMRYSARATSEGLKEDLTRLLEVSTIG